jgi:uncharacterized RDD family membrane protein YckC
MDTMLKKRIIAYIADFFVVSAILWILAWILGYIFIPYSMFIVYNYFIFLLPIVSMIYFIILEKTQGQTIGKQLVFIKVEGNDYIEINYKQAFLRNISKIYWLPIILDYLIGKYVKKYDDKILGVISKTEVVEEKIDE